MANFLTFKNCIFDVSEITVGNSSTLSIEEITSQLANNTCATKIDSKVSLEFHSYLNRDISDNYLYLKMCNDYGGNCIASVDAYYFLSIFGIAFGLFWLIKISKMLNELNNLPKSDWQVYQRKIKLG